MHPYDKLINYITPYSNMQLDIVCEALKFLIRYQQVSSHRVSLQTLPSNLTSSLSMIYMTESILAHTSSIVSLQYIQQLLTNSRAFANGRYTYG